MKVGIVTVHDSSNIGSFLQALGMQELVRQNGDEPIFIKTRSEFSTLCLFLGYYNVPDVRSVKSFIYFMARSIRQFPQTCRMIKKYMVYKRERKAFYNIADASKSEKLKLDVLLLGSDEIWNTRKPTFRNPLLYGIGISAKKKFGYAISIGDMNENGWDKYPQLLDGIKELNGILVRDEKTRNIMDRYKIPVSGRICDPTLQVDIRSYMKDSSKVQLPNGDYIAVYSYNVEEQNRKLIQGFAEKNHLKTIAISLPQLWCDEYINCSPLEFGAILSNAKYVYTSTFHGTIFSVLYHTQFVVKSASPKVSDVLELFDLSYLELPEDCTEEQFSSLLKKKRDYESVENRIGIFREESKKIYKKYILHEDKAFS